MRELEQVVKLESASGAGLQVKKKTGWSGVLQVLAAVFWAFFGVRKSSSHHQDMEKLNPWAVIVAGVLVAAVFVTVLLTIVHWVVKYS